MSGDPGDRRAPATPHAAGDAEEWERFADPVERLALLPPELQQRIFGALSRGQRRELNARWNAWGHDGQFAPPGDWRVWLIRAGRGFGKTRAGAEWVTAMAHEHPAARIALVGHSVDEVKAVMIHGESGLVTIAPDDAPVKWRPATGELTFTSGARAYIYSAEAAEKLRGPEHQFAWCDELAKWRNGARAWDNLMLGLRQGDHQRALVTTTPRPTKLMRRILALPDLVETRGATRDNPHLPASFGAAMAALYGGTRLGRQELDGEMIGDRDGALWGRDGLEACRIAAADVPAMARVVVAVDPPAGGEGDGGDACGIVAAGLGEDGMAYVLEDASIAGASPARWAATVADCAARLGADRVIAEKNQGGAMVAAVLKGADVDLPLKLVHAARGKSVRAEPVALHYEAGRVRHAGAFPALEDQLCGMMIAGGYAGPGRSPDRADALVWAVGELLSAKGTARARRV